MGLNLMGLLGELLWFYLKVIGEFKMKIILALNA